MRNCEALVLSIIYFFRAKDDISSKYETLPISISHNTRAATAIASTNDNSNNNDMIFIPPKTPVRSKTKDTQYHTPSKLITKSG